MTTVPGLDTPLTLPCGTTLRNRIAKAALSEQLGNRSHAPDRKLVTLYERWSNSGAGLLITGNVMVDRRALGEPRNVAIEDDRHQSAMSEWAAAATANNTQAWVQINHPGRQVPRNLSNTPVAPSAIPVSGMAGAFGTPRALEHDEIIDLIRRYATTAGLVVRAGFTGVQIHAAHGYLISQFLSPLTNVRTDEWGGTPERRRRFLLEIVAAVRAEVGPQTPVSVKINSADFQRGGFTEEESLAVVAELASAGIDLIEISGGTYEAPALMLGNPQASTVSREAYFLDFARKVRAEVNVPIMLTGGFRTGSVMNEAIGSGDIDVVGLGRPMALEPDLPARLIAGDAAASTVRPRRIGVKKLDAASELTWHTTQLWRMGDSKEPDARQHPLVGIARYASAAGLDTLRRPLRRGQY
ncbi:NADH:flavin oxidoreductase/NADH oxidase family protein [Hoyosella rhizosphaerae]|uniref:NADH oxidoreductase n=1 Tax=Hoyosella rhizosphaerae TaxID=1755582 RepID=A0A916X8W0_9ACTN|nr:NADH:flavin oxidoreductase/NADH oxidase family protein [Hoyosella rhizosphaerae]MBN4927226.1 NADH:flavin oxidoreductase/NADH oxidase family protein [Hoyosella rhizosphaerae]GGC52974.1 NADH oxidoreductase [Hoyosella rhizosphaerae]